jgi:hypothetical protein
MVSIALIISIYGPYRLLQFFTNWTLLVTLAYHLAGIWASRSRNLKALATHHLTFEIAMLMNIVTVSIYWGTIYKEDVKTVEG